MQTNSTNSKIDYAIHYGSFHDKSEAHYDKMATLLWPQIARHLPADKLEPILDVGCGFGFAIHALRQHGYANTTGLEVSREQAKQAVAAGCKVEVTDDTCEWLKQHEGRFGMILLFDVLEHVPVENQVDFTQSICAALRPGGVLLLTVPNANSPLASRWRYIDYTHYCSFTEHSLTFLLRNAGFGEISLADSKGLRRPSLRFWRPSSWIGYRKCLVRWLWYQVYRAELPHESLDDISFDLNLSGMAQKKL